MSNSNIKERFYNVLKEKKRLLEELEKNKNRLSDIRMFNGIISESINYFSMEDQRAERPYEEYIFINLNKPLIFNYQNNEYCVINIGNPVVDGQRHFYPIGYKAYRTFITRVRSYIYSCEILLSKTKAEPFFVIKFKQNVIFAGLMEDWHTFSNTVLYGLSVDDFFGLSSTEVKNKYNELQDKK